MCSEGTRIRSASSRSRSLRSWSQSSSSRSRRAVAEVDREEVGRGLGLALEHETFLADVAVHHAQDRGDAQLSAERQRELRADVAEDQRRAGSPARQDAGQAAVEGPRPPPRHAPTGPVPVRTQAALDLQGNVVAPGRSDPVAGDLRVVPPSQDALPAVEAVGGDPATQGRDGPVAAVVERRDEAIEEVRPGQADHRLIGRRTGVGAGDEDSVGAGRVRHGDGSIIRGSRTRGRILRRAS